MSRVLERGSELCSTDCDHFELFFFGLLAPPICAKNEETAPITISPSDDHFNPFHLRNLGLDATAAGESSCSGPEATLTALLVLSNL